MHICIGLVMVYYLTGCRNASDASTSPPPAASGNAENNEPVDEKLINLGSFSYKGKADDAKLSPDHEFMYEFTPSADFLYNYESFAKEIVADGRVMGAFESKLTIPYRERIFGGDADGKNQLHIFEFATVHHQVASCVEIEPGFLIYRSGEKIVGIKSLNQTPTLIKQVSVFNQLKFFKSVLSKDMETTKRNEIMRRLGNKGLTYMGLLQLKFKYCRDSTDPNEGEFLILSNPSILRLRPR